MLTRKSWAALFFPVLAVKCTNFPRGDQPGCGWAPTGFDFSWISIWEVSCHLLFVKHKCSILPSRKLSGGLFHGPCNFANHNPVSSHIVSATSHVRWGETEACQKLGPLATVHESSCPRSPSKPPPKLHIFTLFLLTTKLKCFPSDNQLSCPTRSLLNHFLLCSYKGRNFPEEGSNSHILWGDSFP